MKVGKLSSRHVLVAGFDRPKACLTTSSAAAYLLTVPRARANERHLVCVGLRANVLVLRSFARPAWTRTAHRPIVSHAGTTSRPRLPAARPAHPQRPRCRSSSRSDGSSTHFLIELLAE